MTRIYEVLIAVGVLASMTLMNYKGLHWGITAQYILTTIAILVLWLFVSWGIYFIDISHFKPTAVITLPTLLLASVLVIEPFIGWETITYFAEDATDPKRQIPKAIIYSSLFVTVLYGAVIFVTLGLIQHTDIAASRYPLATAAEVFLGAKGAVIIAVGAIIVLVGCLNSWIVSTARLPFAIARDGFFPKFLHHVHKKHGTPHRALLLQFLFASFAVTIATFEGIIYVLVSLAMILYLSIFLSIPVNRMRKVEIPYKLPLGWLIPVIASGLAIVVLSQVKLVYFGTALVLMASGSVVYWYMRRLR